MEYTIKNNDIIAKFNSLGGEMVSVNYKGKERMWQNENGSWSGHAPILFPIAGIIDVTIDGVNYPFNRHGFGRLEEFSLEYQKEDSIKFSLESNEKLLKQFPYEFKLTIEYKLVENKIEETYEIINTGKTDFYGSIGGHTSFKLDEDISNYQLILAKDKEIDTCMVEDNLLVRKERVTNDGIIDLSSHYLDNSETIIMDSVKSKKAELIKKTGEKIVDVEFYNFPHLLLWHPIDSKMICIEPWHNLLDFKGIEKIDFRTKYTIIKIPVGKKEEFKQIFTYYDNL